MNEPAQVKHTSSVLETLNARDFIELSINDTEKRLLSLGLDTNALIDPEDDFHRQVAIMRYNYLLGERSALTFNIEDQNFWRLLRARIQPIILAYRTHHKFVQGLESNSLDKNLLEMLETYRDRLLNSENFKKIFFELKDKGGTEVGKAEVDAVKGESVGELTEKKKIDGSNGIADVQANVIKQLQNTVKEQEQEEKRLQKQLKVRDEENFRHEKTIENLEQKNAELLAEIEKLSTENLQLKLSIDATNKEAEKDTSNGAVAESVPQEVASEKTLQDPDTNELLLKIESLERDLDNTSSSAYNAFMANADLGIVVLFILTAFRTKSISQLGEEVGRSIRTYGLPSVFRIKTDAGVEFYSQGKVSGADKLLFKNNEGKGRSIDVGKNYMIFDERTAILVKDMPISDVDRYGRLKDNLNSLMKGAEASANLITLAQSSEMQQQRMEQLLIRSNDIFNGLAKNLNKNSTISKTAVNSFSTEIMTQLQISPGGPQSIQLKARMKKMQAVLEPLFELNKLVDAKFITNVSKVVEALKRDKA